MVASILLAAGSSNRMGFAKLCTPLNGLTPLERSYRALCAGGVDEIIIAHGEHTLTAAEELRERALVPTRLTAGGSERQLSVLNALRTVNDAEIVVIHDAARCFVKSETVALSIDTARKHKSGVVGVFSTDTARLLNATEHTLLDRASVFLAQTPQTFEFKAIFDAYLQADKDGFTATDDAAIFEKYVGPFTSVQGERSNIKLTTPDDLNLVYGLAPQLPRVGFGEDTHALAPNETLVLGGVEIPFETGLVGHSDADVLLHAIMDAMLGALALGDIGVHFPPSDAQYRGISSLTLLERTIALVHKHGFSPANLDATVIAQKPMLAPHIPLMRERIAATLGMPRECVSIKATTPEWLGFEGRGEGITARCVAVLSCEPAKS